MVSFRSHSESSLAAPASPECGVGGAGVLRVGRRRWLAACALCVGWALGGCTTAVKRPAAGGVSPVAETSAIPSTLAEPVPAPGETQVKAPKAGEVPPRTEGASGVGPALPLPELPPEGKAWVWVESEPPGAMVVVDGVPVGRTPRRVELDVTLQGFARQTNTIRVRFVAESARETSVTTELVLTPRDRVPALLQFTRERVVRRQ